jgi:hypothetical protein
VNYNDIPEGRIAAGQSIWVRATGHDPQLIIREGVKVDSDAGFYRRFPEVIPSFALILQDGHTADRAYVKFRQQANPGYDDWDAVKQDNDGFDLAWRMDDGTLMAIMATNRLLCDGAVLPIIIKDLAPGQYAFDLEKKFDYEHYQFELVDQLTGLEWILGEGEEVTFNVISEDNSDLSWRFFLRIIANRPDLDLTADTASHLYSGDTLTLNITRSTVNAIYVVADSLGRRVSREYVGTGEDMVIPVLADSLNLGRNVLHLIVHDDCSTAPLDTLLFITVVPLPVDVADSVGISDSAKTRVLEAHLFPNPARTSITLETTDSTAQGRIFSATGAAVETPMSEEANGKAKRLVFSVDRLRPGPYFLMINNGKQMEVIRFLKY